MPIRQPSRQPRKSSRYLFTVDSGSTLASEVNSSSVDPVVVSSIPVPTPASVVPSVASTVCTPSSDTYLLFSAFNTMKLDEFDFDSFNSISSAMSLPVAAPLRPCTYIAAS